MSASLTEGTFSGPTPLVDEALPFKENKTDRYRTDLPFLLQVNIMMKFALCVFFLIASAIGQCLTHPSPGVVGVVGVPSQGCNEITNSIVPWLSIGVAPNAANGGPFHFVWNRIPTYFGDPATYQAIISVDTYQPPPFQFPGTSLPNCSWVVGPTLMIGHLVAVSTGCQSIYYADLPSMPGIQGLGLFCQGALWDLTQNKFAITRPFAFQFQ